MTLTLLSIFTILSAWHDGAMYLLRGKSPGTYAEINRTTNYYHITGAGLYVVFIIALGGWQTIITAALVRLTLFDVVNNFASGLPVGFIGSTAFTDRLMSRVFKNAVIKSAVFLITLIIWQIFLYKTFN